LVTPLNVLVLSQTNNGQINMNTVDFTSYSVIILLKKLILTN